MKINLELKEINSEASDIADIFGITFERRVALGDIMESTLKNMKDNFRTSEVMIVLSKNCLHPNELAWGCYILGKNVGFRKAQLSEKF